MSIAIKPVAYEAELFRELLAEAERTDGRFLLRLRDEWLSGALRFEREGEILLGAFEQDRLVGLGGLSLDPYHPAPGLARLRHLYVLRASRGGGIGSALVALLVEHARPRFRAVRLSTEHAAGLYERFGFQPTGGPKETHRLIL